MRIVAIFAVIVLLDSVRLQSEIRNTAQPKQAAAKAASRWQHGGSVTFVGFVKRGEELVTASLDGYLRVWQVSTGRELRRFGKIQESDVPTGSVALSDDGRHLAVGGQDGVILLWDTETGKEIRAIGMTQEYSGITSMDFSPDGRTLAAKCQDQTVRLYEVKTGKLVQSIGKPLVLKQPRRTHFSGGATSDNSLIFSPLAGILSKRFKASPTGLSSGLATL